MRIQHNNIRKKKVVELKATMNKTTDQVSHLYHVKPLAKTVAREIGGAVPRAKKINCIELFNKTESPEYKTPRDEQPLKSKNRCRKQKLNTHLKLLQMLHMRFCGGKSI